MTHIIPPFSSQSDPGYKFLRVFANSVLHIDDIITLYVEGGVPPYDWVVSDGTYLTLGAAQTAGQSNTITSAADAPLGTKETVTVTDAELSEVEIVVCVCNAPCCDSEACDGQVPFALDDDATPDSVTYNDCIDVYVEGGCPPFTWEITSADDEGATKYSLADATTAPRENELCAGACIDNEVSLKVTDACGTEVEFDITGIEGPTANFEVDSDNTPATIDPGAWIYVYVSGGEPPYSWGVVGTGYSLDNASTSVPHNTLRAASGVCGVDIGAFGTITVTDACGNTVTAIIRNTGGEWVQVGSQAWGGGTCISCGGASSPCSDSRCRSVYGTCNDEYWSPPWLSENDRAWKFSTYCRRGTYSVPPPPEDCAACVLSHSCTPTFSGSQSGSPVDPPCETPAGCGGYTYLCGLIQTWCPNCEEQELYCEDCPGTCTRCYAYNYTYHTWQCV